ncbi:MAG: alpha/beta hydrolase family protein [Fermentimonas sp.]|jgi:S-formylglutathione hydrolase FrmB|nr:alpha/beta hydrolase family protein [Fermentimonas sp.]NLC86319.1 esterase family protein [Bacteroidales bacterium]HBT85225.1 XynC protein [Porphyromonadaceae bacterium]MDD2931109.1 alpha/beta hydrolase family protein [Fermentimonas sp.]MDD3188400.1 alpha/beta hydrolase family protein [Fermentimonas sp.]
MKRYFISLLAFILFSISTFSATVDTVNVFSNKMNKSIKTVVIKPEKYDGNRSFPVLYLLHGHGDSYDGWIKKAPSTTELSDLHNIIIICPDGGINSWYWDSPIDSAYQYETFVAKELTNWVDQNLKTIPSREGRAVTGLSMGGHGGLYLGFRNQDIFGACGSMSGGVDIRPFPNNWGMSNYIGKQFENPKHWNEYTVMGLLHHLTPNSLRIIIDCGTDDFFYEVNERLHKELLYRNIPHDYITRPGSHNWVYWNNAIKYQMLYFKEYFEEMRRNDKD